MERRLFVTDMDGTLLDNDGKVSPESARIISELTRKGAMITVATARTPATVEVLLADTDIDIPAIVMTGAAMWDRKSKSYVNVKYHDEAALPSLIGEFHLAGVNPFIYVLGSDDGMLRVYHNGEMTAKERKFYDDRSDLGLKRFILDSPEGEKCPIPGTVLVFALGDADVIEGIAKRLNEDCRFSVSCYRDNFNKNMAYIEVFGKDVSKSAAVLELKDMLHADSLTVYGDNLNDISMLGVADDAVAVANAVPEVLARADRQIEPNFASSVALDIERVIGGR